MIVAEDGAQAIALYALHRDEIAVILKPIMDGPVLISAICRINPKAVIVAASGLSANDNASRIPGSCIRDFLLRSYSADRLNDVHFSDSW